MSILDPVADKPTAQNGADQIRRVFQNSFRQMQMSLWQIRDAVSRFGRSEIESALGSDAKDLASIYSAMKQFIETNETGTAIDDLPN